MLSVRSESSGQRARRRRQRDPPLALVAAFRGSRGIRGANGGAPARRRNQHGGTMRMERLRASCAVATALALVSPGCSGRDTTDLAESTQALIGPPGPAPEVVFPRAYTDILIGRGIRTVTSGRLANSCITLPEGVKYQVANRAWKSEGVAIANQTELSKQFGLDASLSVAHRSEERRVGKECR